MRFCKDSVEDSVESTGIKIFFKFAFKEKILSLPPKTRNNLVVSGINVDLFPFTRFTSKVKLCDRIL